MAVIVRALDPVVGASPRVLILGSMPGVRSLARRQYYVGPGNRFWPLMVELLGFDPGLAYGPRADSLTSLGFALWDVLKACEREGSLDSNIVASSEVLNDVRGFASLHPTLHVIVLNGAKAAASYRRLVRATEGASPLPPSITLPSTSGANTRFTRATLLEAWRKVVTFPDALT
jgi:TDG/mug DNA glycosylase family protein